MKQLQRRREVLKDKVNNKRSIATTFYDHLRNRSSRLNDITSLKTFITIFEQITLGLKKWQQILTEVPLRKLITVNYNYLYLQLSQAS